VGPGSLFIDFLTNLLANIATALLLGLVAWVVVKRKRTRFARFFGLPLNVNQLHIYLSSIAVRDRGSIGTAPFRAGFHGEAISELEFRYANRLSAALGGRASALTIALLGPTVHLAQIASRVSSSPPFRSYPRELAGEARSTDDLDSEVIYTSDHRNELESLFSANGCTVVVGAPVYNILAHYLASQFPAGSRLGTVYEFFRDLDERGNLRNIGIQPRGTADHPDRRVRDEVNDYFLEYFVLEKVIREGHTVMWCAGTSTTATAAALEELGAWPRLAREEGNDRFARLYELRVPRTTNAHKAQELDFNPDIMRVVQIS
jgi:hypothetical protein